MEGLKLSEEIAQQKGTPVATRPPEETVLLKGAVEENLQLLQI
jgi:hypothetical protein